MTLRWLSREGRSPAPVRVTGTPLAVRVVDVPAAPEMPPRPQLRRPDSSLPPVTGGQPMDVCGGLDFRFDPCGAGPVRIHGSDENGGGA